MTVQVKAPGGNFFYSIEWEDEIPETVTLVSVAHTVPSPLVLEEEQTDIDTNTSVVRVSGGVHGGLYQIDALATLSNAEVIPGTFPIRVFNG